MSSDLVLVTGAAGFIGSHLSEMLVRAGFRVRALCHYRGDSTLSNIELLEREIRDEIEIVRGDVRDGSMMRRLVEKVDVVCHLAALIGIPYSYYAPESYVDTNIYGALNVLEACRYTTVRKIVHISTSECYGTAAYTPIDEKHPLQAQSPYAATKIAADKLMESYRCSFDLPVIIVRPFNTYGPRQTARAIVPTIISQLLFTDKLCLGSLEPVRDLTYVTDTANGILCAVKSSDITASVVNLGTGSAISVGELAKLLMKLTGRDLPIEVRTERQRPQNSEVMQLVSDNAKARRELGWAPVVSLEEGLGRTIEFISKYPDLFRSRGYGV